jgi:hypothetical protein
MMRNRLAVGLLAFGLVAASAQQGPKMFKLGVSHTDVWTQHGRPSSFYSGGEHYKAFPIFPRGNVLEVYVRRGGTHIYEARLNYDIDQDSSRLHPSTKVSEVRFAFDRPLRARDALSAIPEAAAVCASICNVFEYRLGNDLHLIVESKNPRDGGPILELSWVGADTITERSVESLDDQVTEVWMYDRGEGDTLVSTSEHSGTLSTWPQTTR